MTTVKQIVAALRGRQCQPRRIGKVWVARCAAHDDVGSSLTVFNDATGQVRIACNAGCSIDAICASIGVPLDGVNCTIETRDGRVTRDVEKGRAQDDVAVSELASESAEKGPGKLSAAQTEEDQDRVDLAIRPSVIALEAKVDGTAIAQSEAQSWPSIVSLAAGKLSEFPTSVLPPVLREWVEAESHATQTPADLAALISLAVCSATIARWVVAEVRPGWPEPVNLFVAVLLDPGNRKSAVHNDALRPLREYESKLIEAEKPSFAAAMSERRQRVIRLKNLEKKAAATGDPVVESEARLLAEQLESEVVPVLPRLIVDDATSEKLGEMLAQQGGRIASMSAEGGVFDLMAGLYGKSGTPQFDVYLKGHSGDDLVTDRISRESIRVERPALTCAYAMQPEVIRGLAGKSAFRGRGLLARFLYATPVSWIGRRKIAASPMPSAVREAYRQRVISLAIGRAERVLTLSTDALAAFELWEQEVETMLGDGGELERLRDWGGKLAGATLRVAATMHCVQCDTVDVIEVPTIKAAVEIGRYLIPHARVALELMDCANSSVVDDAEYIWRWIQRYGRLQFSKRDVHQHGKHRFSRVEDIGPALVELARRGYVRLLPATVHGPGRPPSPVYEVNPLAWTAHVAMITPQNSQNSDTIHCEPSIENFGGATEEGQNRVQVLI